MPHIDVSRSQHELLPQHTNIDPLGGSSSAEEIDLLFDNMNAVVRSAALTEALKYLEVIDPKRDLRPFSIYDDPRAKCVMAAFFYRMMIDSSTAVLQHENSNADVFDLEGRLAQELFRSIIVYRDRIAALHSNTKQPLDSENDDSLDDFLDR